MLSLCTKGCAERPPNADFRQRCGVNLQAHPDQAPIISGSDERRRGLEDLKWSFLFFMVGGALAFVPFVGLIGVLLDLVGLIFFIIGWRALGRSTLSGAPRYRSTGGWLIYAIIITVAVTVVGTIAIVFLFISSALASGITSPNQVQVFFQGQAFHNFLGEIFALVGAASIALLFAWYKVITSLMKLADEVSQPRLRTTGWVFLATLFVGYVALAAVSVMLYTGVISLPAPTTTGRLGAFSYGLYSYPFFTGYGGVAILAIGLVNSGLLILASYMGYKGVKSALQS